MSQDLIKKYVHLPEEYPVLMQQTHKIIKDKKMVNERININENLIHYVQDTALLISEIDGSLEGKECDDVGYNLFQVISAMSLSSLHKVSVSIISVNLISKPFV